MSVTWKFGDQPFGARRKAGGRFGKVTRRKCHQCRKKTVVAIVMKDGICKGETQHWCMNDCGPEALTSLFRFR